MGERAGEEGAERRSHTARSTAQLRARAARLRWVREQLRVAGKHDLTIVAFGEIFGCDLQQMWKLETGHTRLNGARYMILQALERAIERSRPALVWGPAEMDPLERLARIFRLAYADAKEST